MAYAMYQRNARFVARSPPRDAVYEGRPLHRVLQEDDGDGGTPTRGQWVGHNA